MSRWFSVTLASSVIVALVFGLVEITEGQDGRRRDRGPRGPIADFPLTPLPESFTTPADNPQEPARVELGRLLFWDPILSGNQAVACGTCHHPEFGYAENLDISIGVDGAGLGSQREFVGSDPIAFVKRNSQTILNTAFNGIEVDGSYDPATAPMFWDVRAQGLEAQALVPIITFEEMRGHAYAEDEALDDVLEFYDDVGDRDERNINLRRDQIDPLIRNLDDVDDHEDEIIDFLETLNDDSFDKRIPERVPSGLNPGGRIG